MEIRQKKNVTPASRLSRSLKVIGTDTYRSAIPMTSYSVPSTSPFISFTSTMKKRSERRKHCELAVVTRSRKFSPRHRPPTRGRRTAKI